jgi:hypothetical protein
MAGEHRGLLLEAWVVNSISPLLEDMSSTYIWDEKVKGLAVKPDVLINDSSNIPRVLMFITWAGSRTDVKQKFWRNVGELVDAILTHPQLTPISISAVREFSGKENEVFSELAAKSLSLVDLPNGLEVVKALTTILESQSQKLTKERSLALVKRLPEDFVTAEALRSEVLKTLSRTYEALPEIGNAKARIVTIRTRESKQTTVKLAVGQLVLTQAGIRDRLIKGLSVKLPIDELSFLRSCEVLSTGIVSRGSPQIYQAIQLLGQEKIAALVTADEAKANEYIPKLRAMNKIVSSSLEILAENARYLGDVAFIKEQLVHGFHRDSNAVLTSDDNTNTFAVALRTIVPMRYGKQGHGLLEEMAVQTGIIRPQLHGIILPNLERRKNLPAENILRGISAAYASKLRDMTAEELLALSEEGAKLVRYQFRTSVMSHGVDPLRNLIRWELEENSLKFREQRIAAWLANKVNSRLQPEHRLTPNDLSTRCIKVKNTIVHWKSSYDGNEGHKTKELAGRGFSIRDWSSSSKRYLLIIDGDFNNEHINMLYRAGWDKVLYPDEMEELISSIV